MLTILLVAAGCGDDEKTPDARPSGDAPVADGPAADGPSADGPVADGSPDSTIADAPVDSSPANTFIVDCSGGQCGISYTVNGASDPTITLSRGMTYTFQVDAAGHPFAIHTLAGTRFTDGVTGNGVQDGPLTFVVPQSAPDELRYQCENHVAMRGQIMIQ